MAKPILTFCDWRLPLILFALATCCHEIDSVAAEDEQEAFDFPSTIEDLGRLAAQRIALAQKAGGREAGLRMAREELKEAFLQEELRVIWFREMLAHLRDHGGKESLPILEEWLTRAADFRSEKFGTPFSLNCSAASKAWYAIKNRLCKTPAERELLARRLLDPKQKPRLYVGAAFLHAALKEYMPRSREWVYAIIRSKTDNDVRTMLSSPVQELIRDYDEYRPTRQEVTEAMRNGGDTERYVMGCYAMGQPHAPGMTKIARDYIIWAVTQRENKLLLYLAAESTNNFFWSRDEEIMQLTIDVLDWAMKQPLCEELEDTKKAILGIYRVHWKWPALKARVPGICKRFLDTQPPLKQADALALINVPSWRDPRISKQVAMQRSRAEARRAAQELLEELSGGGGGAPRNF